MGTEAAAMGAPVGKKASAHASHAQPGQTPVLRFSVRDAGRCVFARQYGIRRRPGGPALLAAHSDWIRRRETRRGPRRLRAEWWHVLDRRRSAVPAG